MLVYGIISGILYLLLFLVEPIRKFSGESGIALKDNSIFLAVIILLISITIVYIQGFREIKKGISFKKLIVIPVIFHLTLFFVRPMGSDDVFSYIYKARVYSVHSQNPYIVPYTEIKNDAFEGVILNHWSGNTAVYGPVFLLFASFITFIAKDNLWLNVYLFKFFAILANILIIYLIYRLTKNRYATYLYAWNPYILFTFAVDGHNDVFFSLFVLLSIWFLSQPGSFKKYLLATLTFLISVLIKYFSIIAAPFFLVFLLKKLKAEKKLFYLVGLVIISAALVVLMYLPFWDGPVPFNRLLELSQKEEKSTSVFILLAAIPLSLAGVKNYFQISATVSKLVFIALFTTLTLKAYAKEKILKPELAKNYLISFSLLFFILSTWFLPWYSTVVTALIALLFGLNNNNKLPKILYAMTFYQLVFSFVTR